jgi:hypothetical protein
MPRVVVVVSAVMVVVTMVRVRQRDVRQQNQRGREANNLAHDSISPTWICGCVPTHRIAWAASA